MQIILGASLSKKNNKFLNKFLISLTNINVPSNFRLKIIFIIEKKNFSYLQIIKKKLVNKKFEILLIDVPGIPQSRNMFIKYLKKNKSLYAGFIDDDCVVPENWLKNMVKFIKKNKCDIVGGPQLHEVSNKFYLNLFQLIEPQKSHTQNVDWVATNNSFFKSKILNRNNIKFDENLKNIGGSDQLFFKKLSRQNYRCKWNLKASVTENKQSEREKISWFLKRNLRYGYSGSYIDKKIYGNFNGIFLSFCKIFIMLIFSLFFCALFIKKNNFYKSIFYFFRSIGRLLGIINYTPKKYI